jgi:hypothetical protein
MVRARRAGIAGLIAVIGWLLIACAQAGSSVKEAVSNVAASHSAAVTRSAPSAPPARTAPKQQASTQVASPARSAGGGGAATPSLTVGASVRASGTRAADASPEFPWGWFWLAVSIALAAGIAAAAAAWAHRRRRRRSSATAGWQSRVIGAHAEGATLYDAMTAAEMPGALVADGSFSVIVHGRLAYFARALSQLRQPNLRPV